MIQRFQYHALAVGFSGEMTHPFKETIPIRASAALPESGGFGTSRVDHFNFRDIISFKSAHSVVGGSFSEEDQTYDSLGETVIEGLNIFGVVTAERVVARIAASHPADGSEPSITPLGSHFQGLRIAGRTPRLDVAVDTFGKLDTITSVREAYRQNKDGFRDEFNSLSLVNRGNTVPARLRRYFPTHDVEGKDDIPERNGIISCTLIRGLDDLGRELSSFGHAIHVKGFGVIRLAEFKITHHKRSIVMLQVDLGSTPKGSLAAGTAEGNGSGW